MAVVKRVWIDCDICGTPAVDEIGDDRTVVEARATAKKEGFHRTRDGQDFCPDCWEQRAEK